MPPSKGLGQGFFNRIKDRVTRELGGAPTQGVDDTGASQDEQMSPGLWSKILDRAKNLFQREQTPDQTPTPAKPPATERLDPPSIRVRIAQAGKMGVLLLLKYNGVWRHVEPYSFRTRTVKPKSKGAKPGRAEYFYGYCRLHDTIEAYRMERIEGIYITDETFHPRWVIEVA